MALEKKTIVDLIEVTENGCVQVRTKTAILEDGEQISGTFHRHVIVPGDSYANESPRVRAICTVVHTADVVNDYKKAQS